MEGFNKGVVHNYHGTQSAEALRLAAGIISQPDKWDAHFRRSVASAVMSIVYDSPIALETDPSVRQINDQAARVTRAASPGANFVQFFPWMRHIPRRRVLSGRTRSILTSAEQISPQLGEVEERCPGLA